MIRRRYRILLHTLGVCLCLLAAIPVLLYIPAVQQWVVEKVASYLNQDPDSPLIYSVGKVRVDFPADIRLEKIEARWRADSTVCVSLDRLQTGISHFPIGSGRLLSLSDFQLTGLVLGLDSLTTSFGVRGEVPSLTLRGISVNLHDQRLLVQSLDLQNPDLSLFMGPSVPDSIDEPLGWQFDVDAISIHQGHLAYHSSDSSLVDALAGGQRIPYFDYSHISLDSLDILADNLCYNDSLLSINVTTARAIETYSGLRVDELQGHLALDNAIHLNRLHLLTESSSLDGDLSFDWQAMQGSAALYGTLSSPDLTCLVTPYYQEWPNQWPDVSADLLVNAMIAADDVQVDTFSLRLPGYADIYGSADMTALKDSLHRELHAVIHGNLQDADPLISSFVSPATNRNYRIPANTVLDARLDYDSLSASLDGKLDVLESGSIDVSARYSSRSERYHANLLVRSLDAPLFIDNVPLEHATFSLVADGQGFKLPSRRTSAEVRLSLDSVLYVRHDGRKDLFSSIQGSATLKRGDYTIDLHSEYPVLTFKSLINGKLLPDELSANGFFKVTHADMQHLPAGFDIDYGVFTGDAHLSAFYDWDRIIDISLDVDSMTYVELQEVPRDSLNRPILRHLESIRGNHVFHDFDPIDLNFHTDADSIRLRIYSGDCDIKADLATDIHTLADMSNLLSNEVERLVDESSIDLAAISNVLPQSNIQATMGEKNPLLPLMRAYGYETTSASISFLNDAYLSADIHICDLRLPDRSTYDTICFNLKPGFAHSYHYDGRLVKQSLKPNDSYCLISEGQVMRDSLVSRIQYTDVHYVPIFEQTISAATEADVITIRLLSDPILFAKSFTVNPDTYIELCHPAGSELPWEVYGRLSFDLDSIPVLRAELSYADSILVDLHLQQLPLSLANLYTQPTMELSGSASGDFSIHANSADLQRSLQFDGSVCMDKGAIALPEYGMKFLLPNDSLTMGRNRLLVKDYPIKSDGGGLFTLRGLIDFSKDLGNPSFGLDLRADKAYVMRKSRRLNNKQLLAGSLPITTNIRMEGQLNNLSVHGNLDILQGTDLTYWMTDDPLQTGSKVDELVGFVSFHELDRRIVTKSEEIKPTIRKDQKRDEGLQVNMNLNIDRATRMNVSLSPLDDSKVEFVGGGQLQMKMPVSDNLTLSGTFDIGEGSVDYKLPMLPVSKHFELRNGSYVQWPGVAPSNPTIHLIAGQNIRTSVSDQASGTRLVTFAVDANIVGTLSSLGVSFDCMAPDDGAIATELQALTEEDRQKQALMLLIAQTYIGPSASSSSNAGLSTASAALNSLIAREIDGITSGLKHTKVDLGIDTYGEEGQSRTDLSLKVSQTFFNDRVRFSVGGKVSTGGNDMVEDQSAATLGDVSLDWMIRRDGSQYLDLFRRTNFKNILEGQVIEMGTGYVQERSAYRFLDLLSPSTTKREKRLQEMYQQINYNNE